MAHSIFRGILHSETAGAWGMPHPYSRRSITVPYGQRVRQPDACWHNRTNAELRYLSELGVYSIYINSDYLVSTNVVIWNNVGASEFYEYVEYVLDIASIGGYQESIEIYDTAAVFWCAGRAFDKEYFSKTFENFSSSKIAEIEEYCESYAQCMDNVTDIQELIQALIDIMADDYSDEYSSKMNALQDWWVESSLYADHALNPDGSLSSYTSNASTYQENIKRCQKVAGY